MKSDFVKNHPDLDFFRDPRLQAYDRSRQRYDRYRQHCEDIIHVRPMAFELWQQIEPWLEERGRIAILDQLRFHCKPGSKLRGSDSGGEYEARPEVAHESAVVTIGA